MKQSIVNDTPKPWVIIFLDIDGVLFREPFFDDFYEQKKQKLNALFGPQSYYSSLHWDTATSYFFNKNAVALLEDFIETISLHYKVGIVLSSAWREGKTVEQVRSQIFANWHFSKFIIDKTVDGDSYYTQEMLTPSMHSLAKYGFALESRADQIDYWLREHREDMHIAQFIILDDIDSGLSKKFPTQFVHVQKGLLSPRDIQSATFIINPLLTENQATSMISERPQDSCQTYP